MNRIRRTTLALALAVGAVAAATAPATARADKASDARERVGLPSISEQQRYRDELGLPSSAATVRDLNERWAQGNVPGATTEGAVLTPDEERELDTREGAGHEIATAARALFADDPAGTFAGVYIDNANGKTVVLVTRDADAVAAKIRARVTNGSRLAMRTVTFPMARLSSIADTVAGTSDALRDRGANVTATDVDEVANRTAIGLSPDTATARAVVASALAPGDVAAVRFYDSGPATFAGVQTLNAPPVKGGQVILSARPDGFYNQCTSAFDAYRQTRTDAGIWVYDRYMITAAHCKLGTTAGAGWFQTELYFIGVADQDTLASQIDSMRVPLSKPVDRSNLVAITSTTDRYIYYRQSQSADVLGERVCMSGARTGGEVCGTLLSRSHAETIEGIPLRYLRIASFNAREGDSGGSVLQDSTAKGIVSCSTYYNSAWRMCYQHVHTALGYLGLTNVEGA
ncbi:MAG TPA: hypothetical protein VGX28_14655 [Frankiaceae bacterium]|jgi:hypothetical protein|nr:hypothetical protein [Frankiaceae bacterium]